MDGGRSTKNIVESQNQTTLFFAPKKSSVGKKTRKFNGSMITSKVLEREVKRRKLKRKEKKKEEEREGQIVQRISKTG